MCGKDRGQDPQTDQAEAELNRGIVHANGHRRRRLLAQRAKEADHAESEAGHAEGRPDPGERRAVVYVFLLFILPVRREEVTSLGLTQFHSLNFFAAVPNGPSW
jgi:hypothetical protein